MISGSGVAGSPSLSAVFVHRLHAGGAERPALRAGQPICRRSEASALRRFSWPCGVAEDQMLVVVAGAVSMVGTHLADWRWLALRPLYCCRCCRARVWLHGGARRGRADSGDVLVDLLTPPRRAHEMRHAVVTPYPAARQQLSAMLGRARKNRSTIQDLHLDPHACVKNTCMP